MNTIKKFNNSFSNMNLNTSQNDSIASQALNMDLEKIKTFM